MTRRCCQRGSEGCLSLCDVAASEILFHGDTRVANSKVLVNTHPCMEEPHVVSVLLSSRH